MADLLEEKIEHMRHLQMAAVDEDFAASIKFSDTSLGMRESVPVTHPKDVVDLLALTHTTAEEQINQHNARVSERIYAAFGFNKKGFCRTLFEHMDRDKAINLLKDVDNALHQS